MSHEWYYTKDGHQHGPISGLALRDLAASGQIKTSDFVWKEGMANWIAAAHLKGLSFPPSPINEGSPTAVPGRVIGQPPFVSDTVPSPPARPHNIVPMRVELPEASAVANEAPSWYYVLNGKRIGPVPDACITQLLGEGTIDNGTLVWRNGFNDWIPIAETSLRKTITGPPPLTGSAVNNSLAWTVAFAPIIGTLLAYVIAQANNSDPANLWFITLALNITLCLIDDHLLSKAGHDTKKFGAWAWLVPVYLYKRATALKQSLAYFTTWMICFFVSLFL